MLKISLKGDIREFEPGIPLIDAAKSISEGLARNACCALVDGKMTDLRTPLTADCTVEFCNFDTDEGGLRRADDPQCGRRPRKLKSPVSGGERRGHHLGLV